MAITIFSTDPVPYNEFDLLTAGEDGKSKVVEGEMNIGTSYTSPGGELIVAADFSASASSIQTITFGSVSSDGDTHAWYDVANGKIVLTVGSTGVEVGNGIDVESRRLPFKARLKP